jgi:hypothetical protein
MYNIITDDAQLQQQKWRKSNVVDRRTPPKKRQTMVNKTLHRRRKIEQHELH